MVEVIFLFSTVTFIKNMNIEKINLNIIFIFTVFLVLDQVRTRASFFSADLDSAGQSPGVFASFINKTVAMNCLKSNIINVH